MTMSIEFMNKAIGGEINKDKPLIVKEIEDTTTPAVVAEPKAVQVTPIGKFYAPDGTELMKVPVVIAQ
jgi:hypothetical protein